MVKNLLVIIVFICIFVSCKNGVADKSEGVITYKITYPKIEKTNYMLGFMPTEMKMYFKDNKYITMISAGMGTFKTSFICDKNQEELYQLVKLINKKYLLELKGEQISLSNELLPNFDIDFIDDVTEILGYNCKKAVVTIDNETKDAFTVYYTDAIKIENPNWCNQFSPINGVMLEYQYEKYDICMQFKATKVSFEKVSDQLFEIPSDYKVVSEEEMSIEMTEIFDSFK